MTTSQKEAKALGHPEYWDERYSRSDGEQPTHEWFKTYDDLQPFLEKHLFGFRNPQAHPRILHLGAGDSVRIGLPISVGYLDINLGIDDPKQLARARLQESALCGLLTGRGAAYVVSSKAWNRVDVWRRP